MVHGDLKAFSAVGTALLDTATLKIHSRIGTNQLMNAGHTFIKRQIDLSQFMHVRFD